MSGISKAYRKDKISILFERLLNKGYEAMSFGRLSFIYGKLFKIEKYLKTSGDHHYEIYHTNSNMYRPMENELIDLFLEDDPTHIENCLALTYKQNTLERYSEDIKFGHIKLTDKMTTEIKYLNKNIQSLLNINAINLNTYLNDKTKNNLQSPDDRSD
ncbi:MAG: hypothetical protein CML98_08285 [Rhodobiaceae bacterium]|nr:hypothetical protein [Rhodobiaceae bacterium]|tara:strand:+ start:6971 stop:7444 length:474 start_codon:yes stop_codon:yes gene_type:complete